MISINRHKRGSILMIVFVGIFIIALLASTVVPAFAAQKTSRFAYHDEWRQLWEDHITWTRVVIISILDGLPGTTAYVNRLLQNPGDMAAALKPYYGDEADVLGNLITDHLVIAARILQAIHDTGQVPQDLLDSWYDNAHDIAVQMNRMNPQFWPLDEAETMWKDHLDATVAEVLAHQDGRFADEVAAYDLVHNLALDMADFFSSGAIKQFPNRFNSQ